MPTETLTVLFTDLVGSTRAVTSLQPRQADLLLARHFSALRHELDRRDGHEVKTLGDGLMATFRSARSAIDAAAAMQRAVACQSHLVIRIGIASGDVHTRDHDCVGVPVIEASRLCDAAAARQILLGQSTRLLARDCQLLVERGETQLKGISEPTRIWEARWFVGDAGALRVVLADDAALLREGVAHVLEAAGMDVVGQASDPEDLFGLVSEHRPDLAVVDVRMPPTFTQEGLDVAIRIRRTFPQTGVLLLSMDAQPRYAARLVEASPTGVGYLLKESITDIQEFTAVARSVAAGGTAFSPRLRLRGVASSIAQVAS